MGKIKVLFYETRDGKEPAKDFISDLEPKMRAKVLRTISMLENNGGDLREPTSKPLGDGIFELRTQLGNNETRILYFFFVGSRAILTNGFIKKSQKTPKNEIELAKQYRNDFLNREGMNDD